MTKILEILIYFSIITIIDLFLLKIYIMIQNNKIRKKQEKIEEKNTNKFLAHLREMKEKDAENSEFMDKVEEWGNEISGDNNKN